MPDYFSAVLELAHRHHHAHTLITNLSHVTSASNASYTHAMRYLGYALLVIVAIAILNNLFGRKSGRQQ